MARVVDDLTMDNYYEYTFVDVNDKKYDDSKYNWEIVFRQGGDYKFGRLVVSEEYKLRRELTMKEF